MKNRVKTCLIASALTLSPTLAGCASPADMAPPDPTKKVARTLNAAPKHIVRIEGRIPDSLKVELIALYVTDTKDMTCFNDPSAQWGLGPNYHRERIELSRSKGSYTATLVVDKFLPGNCNWTLAQVNAAVGKVDKPDDEAEVVEKVVSTFAFYREQTDASGCDINPRSMDKHRCPVEANALSTPVVVPCKIDSYAENKPPSFYCPALTKSKYKVSHRVTPTQKVVEMNFYDLDKEPDPT